MEMNHIHLKLTHSFSLSIRSIVIFILFPFHPRSLFQNPDEFAFHYSVYSKSWTRACVGIYWCRGVFVCSCLDWSLCDSIADVLTKAISKKWGAPNQQKKWHVYLWWFSSWIAIQSVLQLTWFIVFSECFCIRIADVAFALNLSCCSSCWSEAFSVHAFALTTRTSNESQTHFWPTKK